MILFMSKLFVTIIYITHLLIVHTIQIVNFKLKNKSFILNVNYISFVITQNVYTNGLNELIKIGFQKID